MEASGPVGVGQAAIARRGSTELLGFPGFAPKRFLVFRRVKRPFRYYFVIFSRLLVAA